MPLPPFLNKVTSCAELASIHSTSLDTAIQQKTRLEVVRWYLSPVAFVLCGAKHSHKLLDPDLTLASRFIVRVLVLGSESACMCSQVQKRKSEQALLATDPRWKILRHSWPQSTSIGGKNTSPERLCWPRAGLTAGQEVAIKGWPHCCMSKSVPMLATDGQELAMQKL